MIISHKYKLVFIHIPKSGGTFVSYLLHNLDENIINGNGHMTFNQIKRSPAYDQIKDYTFFTVIRDPIDNIFSSYNYILTNPKHYLHNRLIFLKEQLSTDHSFDDFLSIYVNNFIPNLHFIYGDNDNTNINNRIFIVRFSNLIDDIKNLFDYLSLPFDNISHIIDQKINESDKYIKLSLTNYSNNGIIKILQHEQYVKDILFFKLINNNDDYNTYLNQGPKSFPISFPYIRPLVKYIQPPNVHYTNFYNTKMAYYLKSLPKEYAIEEHKLPRIIFSIMPTKLDEDVFSALIPKLTTNSHETYIFDEFSYPLFLSFYHCDSFKSFITNFLVKAKYIVFFCEIFENENLKTIGNNIVNREFATLFFKHAKKVMLCNTVNIFHLFKNNICQNICYFPPLGYSPINNIQPLETNEIKDVDILFMGSIDDTVLPYRSKVINQVMMFSKENNYNFVTHNLDLFGEFKDDTLKRTKIVLHIPSFEHLTALPWAKVAELMAKKIFVMIETNAEVYQIPNIKDIMVHYLPGQDMLDKIQYYLQNEDERTSHIQKCYDFIQKFNLDYLIKYTFDTPKLPAINHNKYCKDKKYNNIKYFSYTSVDFHENQKNTYLQLFKEYLPTTSSIINAATLTMDYSRFNTTFLLYMANEIGKPDIADTLYYFNSIDFYFFYTYLSYDNYNLLYDFFNKIHYVFVNYEVICNSHLDQIGLQDNLYATCNLPYMTLNERRPFVKFFYQNAKLNILCNNRNIRYLAENNINNTIYYIPFIYHEEDNKAKTIEVVKPLTVTVSEPVSEAVTATITETITETITVSEPVSEPVLELEPEDLISIILPTFNRAHLLKQCINNILSQSYKNIELIVVNDCSTDDTGIVLKEYEEKEKNNNIRVITHEINRGTPGALNNGFKAAKGKYLTWTSDDNLLHADFCKEFMTTFKDNVNVDFAYCDYMTFSTDINRKDNKIVRPNYQNKLDFLVSFGGCAGFMWTRKVFEAIGEFDCSLFGIEDWDYLLRIIFKGFKYQKINKTLYYYKIHPESLTSKIVKTPKYDELHNKVCQKFIQNFPDFLTSENIASSEIQTSKLGLEYIKQGHHKKVVKMLLSELGHQVEK